jgi:glycosyltransferase involved in cell wall biosynthesis
MGQSFESSIEPTVVLNLLIVDNSIAFTGAFKAAFNQAVILSDKYNVSFLINKKSANARLLNELGIPHYSLHLRELRRSLIDIILYLPLLIINSFRLVRLLKNQKIDVIQINDYYNLLGVLSKLMGYKGKLITYVRLLPSSTPFGLDKLWFWFAQKFSHKVIVVSDAVLTEIPQRINVVRIYDPVQFFEKYPIRSDVFSANEFKFLYLANYTKGKGQEYAIYAFMKALQKNPNIRLDFFGGDFGLEKNRVFRMELEQMVVIAGLNDVIKFYDFVQDIEDVIKDHSVLLNFSISESFSMTCAEASFYGRPVIATRCGGPEEIIENRVSGLLVPVGDISAMADAMISLSLDRGAAMQMGVAGSRRIRQMFSVVAYKNHFLNALNS